jgi:threonine dehydrogenase-like Zn-dependent dehydrogenase
MGTGFHAVVNAGTKPGDTVAVLGLGPVGLCAVQAARAAGAAQVFAIDSVAQRLEMAASFGATPVHLTEQDPKGFVRAATDKRGVDVVIDAVGNPEPFALAVSLARDAGTISGVGAYAGKAEIPLGLMWIKALRFVGGQANVVAHVDRVLALMAAGVLDPAPLVSSHMQLAEAPEAYRIYDRREALKIVLTP